MGFVERLFERKPEVPKSLAEHELGLRQSRLKIRFLYYLAWITFLCIGASAFFYYIQGEQLRDGVVAIITIFPALFIFLARWRIKANEEELQTTLFDKELEQFSEVLDDRQKRAEKLLRVSHNQLRQYYQLNLAQNRWLLGLGVSCIVLGIVMIIGTVYVAMNAGLEPNERIIISVTGFVSSVLVNFIAALFIRMHSAANLNFSEFHTKLAQNHQLLLGNLLVSGITDEKQRFLALSKIAFSLAGQPENRAESSP